MVALQTQAMIHIVTGVQLHRNRKYFQLNNAHGCTCVHNNIELNHRYTGIRLMLKRFMILECGCKFGHFYEFRPAIGNKNVGSRPIFLLLFYFISQNQSKKTSSFIFKYFFFLRPSEQYGLGVLLGSVGYTVFGGPKEQRFIDTCKARKLNTCQIYVCLHSALGKHAHTFWQAPG